MGTRADTVSTAENRRKDGALNVLGVKDDRVTQANISFACLTRTQ